MSANGAIGHRPKFWVPGDWNALFGFGTNILVNVLVLTGLLRFVLKMPEALVFGRILPALGMMLFLSTGYYAFHRYQQFADGGDLLSRRGGDPVLSGEVCRVPSNGDGHARSRGRGRLSRLPLAVPLIRSGRGPAA